MCHHASGCWQRDRPEPYALGLAALAIVSLPPCFPLSLSPSLPPHLKHEVLDDAVELAALVVQRHAVGGLALVALAQVQEVRARLGAGVGVQLERDALGFLVSHLWAERLVVERGASSPCDMAVKRPSKEPMAHVRKHGTRHTGGLLVVSQTASHRLNFVACEHTPFLLRLLARCVF